ncbi:hypothetical protein L228DRAFT_266711 [Xylona heveae TC161]|uniref:Zn(2)-C6 fungal-type domain-containing protein n=1 Tax=Xylona heveae (strain CBS 132557 / TC161) TaxID=1328760 RepID=A0A165I4F8_XYLHT|nr:hypothetical protein L228DRAFT_266711 [Xylona heveae TC161]KZF24368.1 hypothetical protein L228DRAFT_266711 [Xylona heveae TC161]
MATASARNKSSDDFTPGAEGPAPITTSLVGNTAPAAAAAHPPRIRRRNRMITSCLECRRRKLRCNRSQPCVNCTKANRDCVFLAPATDAVAQLKLKEVKEKMGDLELGLARDAASNVTREDDSPARTTDRNVEQEDLSFLPAAGDDSDSLDEQHLVATPNAIEDAVYDDDADDVLMDLGIQLGKIDMALKHTDDGLEYTPLSSSGFRSLFYKEDLRRSLEPPPMYLEPSPGFLFGGIPERSALMDYLPSRSAADRLIGQYFDSVHYIARVVHRPTFERQYRSFWAQVSLGIEPTASLQALVFAAMFSAIVSMPEETSFSEFGVNKARLTENFLLGTESALARANFLRTSKIETLQAFVMYLIPICRDQLSRTHAVLVAAAIRIAQCMGLHRDGTNYGLSPLETHVRRLIWYQLCYLDIRSCDAHGPRPSIRRDDFDTKFPLNVDDTAFGSSSPPTEDAPFWTDMTFARVRFECHETHRMIWFERPRLERKEITLLHLLGKVDNFRRTMQEKFLTMLDDTVPLHRYARLVFQIHFNRNFLMILHRFMASPHKKIPDRLRQVAISCAVEQLEAAIEIETSPELRPWLWFSRTCQQFHSGLFLLIEIYFYPNQPLADRVWKVLDYTFELSSDLPREVKARRMLTEIRDRTDVYRELRKMRAPANLEGEVGSRVARVSQRHEQEEAAKDVLETSAGVTGINMGTLGDPSQPAQASSPSNLSWFNLPFSTFLPNQSPAHVASVQNRLDVSYAAQQRHQKESEGKAKEVEAKSPSSPQRPTQLPPPASAFPSPISDVSRQPVKPPAAYTPLGFVSYADQSVQQPDFGANYTNVPNPDSPYTPAAHGATVTSPSANLSDNGPGVTSQRSRTFDAGGSLAYSPTAIPSGQKPIAQNYQYFFAPPPQPSAPPTIESRSTNSSSPDELMLDIDWDEWDRLFPQPSVV